MRNRLVSAVKCVSPLLDAEAEADADADRREKTTNPFDCDAAFYIHSRLPLLESALRRRGRLPPGLRHTGDSANAFR